MRLAYTLLLIPALCQIMAGVVLAQASPDQFHQLLDSYEVVDAIDTSMVDPLHVFPAATGYVTNILGKRARLLPPADSASGMAWVIGKNKGLKAGEAYVLSIEFPDDVPRSIFIANRGADQVRGFATGNATGDVRQQYTQPSLESLDYPQSGRWQRYRSVFVLHHRFQGLKSQRDPKPGGRPFTPEDGFHVLIFQSAQINDPRSHGAAIGSIRLHKVPSLDQLTTTPAIDSDVSHRRQVFFREEMGDEPISSASLTDRAVPDPVNWYVAKARVARVLGFNTFSKDLLEFGHNQGWKSPDGKWYVNAQPPLEDLWDRLVPEISKLGMNVLPYFEYKGSLGFSGATPRSLGWQRRAEKLYHGKPNTNYTGVWWVEQHNADLTDPETLQDAKRLLDATVARHANKAVFSGAWFRTRGNHLPISFSESIIARFRATNPNTSLRDRDDLIRSYEGDKELYRAYSAWWFERRVQFLTSVQSHLAQAMGRSEAQLLFTPWPGEPIPVLRQPQSGGHAHLIQVLTDDPTWWDAFARKQANESWFRWAYVPMNYRTAVEQNAYGFSLKFEEPISPLPWRSEDFHAAPPGDPERYRSSRGVMMTFPIGRLITVARKDLLEHYRTASGLTVIRHYPLNEDNPADQSHKGPFGGEVGYACVDVDRAGPHILLQEARALAAGDAINIGYLCGSAYSTGFPGYVRRFNQAFTALPTLGSSIVSDACTNAEVVVRTIRTSGKGDYFMVINTSMDTQTNVLVNLPGSGPLTDVVDKAVLKSPTVRATLYSGELRVYHKN